MTQQLPELDSHVDRFDPTLLSLAHHPTSLPSFSSSSSDLLFAALISLGQFLPRLPCLTYSM